MDRGPWTVEDGGVRVYSGDFDGPDDRQAYAEWLARVLNAAAKGE